MGNEIQISTKAETQRWQQLQKCQPSMNPSQMVRSQGIPTYVGQGFKLILISVSEDKVAAAHVSLLGHQPTPHLSQPSQLSNSSYRSGAHLMNHYQASSCARQTGKHHLSAFPLILIILIFISTVKNTLHFVRSEKMETQRSYQT